MDILGNWCRLSICRAGPSAVGGAAQPCSCHQGLQQLHGLYPFAEDAYVPCLSFMASKNEPTP